MRYWLSWLAGLVALGAAAAALWRYAPAPLIWTALTFAACCVVIGVRRVGLRREALFTAASALLAIAAIEAFLWLGQRSNIDALPEGFSLEGSYVQPGYFFAMPEPLLGYRPRPGVSAKATKRFRDKIVYDVAYSIGEDGLRVSPPARDQIAGCVLFFGDSFAWGEGVRDEETAAYQLGLLSQGSYRVYNFAVTGYSAHQLWTQVRRFLVRDSIQCQGKPVHAIYEVLPSNVARAAGLGVWDRFGPRYILNREGVVRYRGSFQRGDYLFGDRIFVPRREAEILSRAKLYERTLGRARSTHAFDAKRFFALVQTSARTLAEQIDGLKFTAILWPEMDDPEHAVEITKAMFRGLTEHGIDTRYIDDVIPGYAQNFARYHIPLDGHPTPEAHRKVAEYVWSELQRSDGVHTARAADLE